MSDLHIGDALRDFLNKSKLKSGLRAVQIESIWEEVMGKTIARHTEKIQIVNQTLFIYTSVGALKQELLYQKPKIIERINEALHEQVISEVIIK
jgi:predicted nucleic acid-binding Zn ribbon protein